MLRLAVFVSGGGTNLQALMDQIEEKGWKDIEIRLLLSNNPSAYALERGKERGIPIKVLSRKSCPDGKSYEDALINTLKEYEIDLVVLAGCLFIIPEAVVRQYENKIINIHPSLIPAFCGDGYYGLKVHEGALARGVKVTGATVHFVDCGTDTGPIILQKTVAVLEGDTPEVLQRRVMEEAEWEILPQAVKLIAEQRVVVEGNQVRILG